MSLTVYEDELYILGGTTSLKGRSNIVRKYNPSDGEWEFVEPINEDRLYFAAVVLNDADDDEDADADDDDDS